MIEITKLIHRQKFISTIINSVFHSFFFAVRIMLKPFAFSNGNVVVISLHKLGDAVFTIPAIREIQKFYKKNIIVVCYSETIPIYKLGLRDVQYCEIEHNHFYFNKRITDRKGRKILRTLKPEIIYDFTGVMTSASLIFNARAKKIIGTNRNQFKAIYNLYTPVRTTPHLMDIYLDVVSLVIPGIKREQAKIFPCNIMAINKILIHPFAGWEAKEWSLGKFIKLSETLKNDFDVSFVVPVNSLPEDVADEIKYKNIDIIETHTTDELINCINECSLFIGNDSGPLHIASLMGKPTFGIYGPTNPEYHSPLGNYNSFSLIKIKCSPEKGEKLCFTEGGRVGCPSFECMERLSLEQVLNDLLEFIKSLNKKEISMAVNE
jgi:ADP-heptose:LPS heptosyltransferase